MKGTSRAHAFFSSVRLPLVLLLVMAITVCFLGEGALLSDESYAHFTKGLHRLMTEGSFFPLLSLESNADIAFAQFVSSPLALIEGLLPSTLFCAALMTLVRIFLAALALFILLRIALATRPLIAFALSAVYGFVALGAHANATALATEQMILLPLLLLAFARLYDGKGLVFPVLSLFFAITTGAPFLFINILLFVLFFAADLFASGRLHDKAAMCRFAKRALLCLSIALACALPYLIYAMPRLHFENAFRVAEGTWLYRIPFALLSFMPGTSLPGYAVMYAGIAALLLLPVYFHAKGIARWEKLAYALLLFLLFAFFFFFTVFDGIFGYAVTFLLLLCAARLFPHHRGALLYRSSYIALAVTATVLLALPFLFQIANYALPTQEGSTAALGTLSGVYIPVLLTALTAIALSAFCDPAHEGYASRGVMLFLVCLTVFDGFCFAHFRTVGEFAIEAKDEETPSDALLLSSLKKEADYRFDTPFYPLYDKAITAKDAHNASNTYLSDEIKELFSALGIPSADMMAENPAISAIFGKNALISANYRTAPFYRELLKEETLTLYETPSLPLVYTASKDVLSYVPMPTPEGALNGLYAALLGREIDVCTAIPLTFRTEEGEGHGSTWQFTTYAEEDSLLFAVCDAYTDNFTLTGAKSSYRISRMTRGMLYPLGSFGEGARITLSLAPIGNARILPSLSVYAISMTALEEARLSLTAQGATDITIQKNCLTCTVTVSEGDVVMTALPYSDSFTVTSNEQALKTANIAGLLAVEGFTGGTHTLTVTRASSPTMMHVLLALILLALFLTASVLYPTILKKHHVRKKTH